MLDSRTPADVTDIVKKFSPEVAAACYRAISKRWINNCLPPIQGDTLEPSVLLERCSAAGISPTDMVTRMVHSADPLVAVALEQIMDKDLRPPREEVEAQAAAREQRRRSVNSARQKKRTDGRIVVEVIDNPKKPGSSAHIRFAHWRVGMTVDEFIAAGGTAGDVAWDTKHGYVRLGAPAPRA